MHEAGMPEVVAATWCVDTTWEVQALLSEINVALSTVDGCAWSSGEGATFALRNAIETFGRIRHKASALRLDPGPLSVFRDRLALLRGRLIGEQARREQSDSYVELVEPEHIRKAAPRFAARR